MASSLGIATRVQFSEVRHLLPQDCWAIKSERAGREFENETVLMLEGDHRLASLDLDDPLGTDDHVFLVFIRGALTVDGTIRNQDTEGASGLIVDGNLTCRNAVVGGQQIYVSGNFNVQDLFWGDYNHGELLVKGNASARLFLTTEQYSFSISGVSNFERWIFDRDGDEGWRLDDPDALGDFIDSTFITDDDDSAPLARDEILSALRAGQVVIQAPQQAESGSTVHDIFPDQNVIPDNIRRVAAADNLVAGGDDDALGSLEFWSDDLFIRLMLLPDGKNAPERKLYFQLDEKIAVLVGLFNRPPTFLGRVTAAIKSLVGQPREQHLIKLWRNVEDEGTWAYLDTSAPAEVHDLVQRGWDTAMQSVVNRRRVRKDLDPGTLRGLLALPLAEPYDDFYDDDRNGLWVGSLYCSFRQADAKPGDTQMLRVTASEDDTDLVFFEIVQMADGSECVLIKHMDDLDEEEYTYPWLAGGDALDTALRMFAAAKRNLERGNKALLRGERVADDGFAIKHWRHKGYLKSRVP
ncbi:hypothetical protein GAO09_10665 [Rhizobiales bacterium RZME27]|uniref:Uncharacterized protein n=1 Tax=Endobacterium cereale TaxID=2663029 RepID=A0A6A8ABD8_9HYPH|nr:hypothetical protein [Endobacterium cereale]MQY46506.1 hypothetical protein [Endobacterium cereale]